MNYSSRANQRANRVARSQLAVRLGLALYAALTAAIALRCMVLFFDLPQSVFTVSAILRATDPLLLPLRFVPGAERVILGSATLSDLTVVLLLIALPLPFLGGRARRSA